jgi:hypothetical protein
MFVFRACLGAAVALALPTAALAAPVAVRGTLLDAAGRPAAGVVRVYLGRDAPRNGAVVLRPLAVAHTSSDGRFAAGLEPRRALAAFAAANGGYLNLDVVAQTSAGLAYRAVSRRFASGAWVDQAGRDPAPTTLVTRLAVRPKVQPTCVVVKRLVGIQRRHTAIGELHNASNVVVSRLAYGSRADSDISVGFSSTGAFWSLSGSYHVGNQEASVQTTSVTADNWGHRILTDFSYGKYRYVNGCGGSWYTVQARYWIPGRYVGTDNSTYDHHCRDRYAAFASHFGPNDAFARSTSRYFRFVAAALVGLGTGGLALQAQSGLSHSVDVYWKFGGRPDHYLCGSDGPITTAHRIFAGA